MSARKYANAEARSGLLPPRLEILHRGLTIAVAAERSDRDVERRTSRNDEAFQRGDIRAQAREQQIQDVLVLEDLGRNPSVATIDFGDKNMIREMTERRKRIGYSRRPSAGHDQVTRRGQAAISQGVCQLVGEHCAHAVAEEGESPFEMRREI
jgi:hypothetical protein